MKFCGHRHKKCPSAEGRGSAIVVAAMPAATAVHDGLYLVGSANIPREGFRVIMVFVGCIIRSIPAVTASVYGNTVTGIIHIARHVHRHDRPRPGPIPAAAVPAGLTGAAGAGIVGKAVVIVPPVSAVGKGPGYAAQGAIIASAAAIGITATGGTAIAAVMMIACGTAAASVAAGLVVAVHLRVAVITARAAARTMLLHICHEKILLSSEASASRDTLHPMPVSKKGFATRRRSTCSSMCS